MTTKASGGRQAVRKGSDRSVPGRDMTRAALAAALADQTDDLARLGSELAARAELGFREERTAATVADALRALGLSVESGLALTGLRARLSAPNPGPRIAIIGELDALPIPDHPDVNPETGAAHACGHHAQLVHLIGLARALVETNAMAQLAGEVIFVATPAEEYVDIEWRAEQAARGRIEFLGGKAELIRLGIFDDVDLALMAHAKPEPNVRLGVDWASNGFRAKRVRFAGRASHAANAPERGVNALNAATLAMSAIHMQRETFRDEDHVRVHWILTRGGEAVNVVAAEAAVELFVRGATMEAIEDAERKVDRSLRAGALAIGAAVEIDTLPGYLPLAVDRELAALFRRHGVALVGEAAWIESPRISASTDAGDLSQLLPVLHGSHGGGSGALHSRDFRIVDPRAAYVLPATAMAWTIVDLLADGAVEGRRIGQAFSAALTKAEYLARQRALRRREWYEV